MSIQLINTKKQELQLSNTSWCYILNLGELYGWKPEGTKKPNGYGLFKKWDGSYDSSDGQLVTATDSKLLGYALRSAVSDNEFSRKSAKLLKSIQEAIEKSIGGELPYSISRDIDITFIEEVSAFLYNGDFIIC